MSGAIIYPPYHWKRKYDWKWKSELSHSILKYKIYSDFPKYLFVEKNLLFKVNQHAENLPLPAWCFTDGKSSIQRVQLAAQDK